MLASGAPVSTGAALAVRLPIASGIKEDVREIRTSVETVTQSLHAVDRALAAHKRMGASAARSRPFDQPPHSAHRSRRIRRRPARASTPRCLQRGRRHVQGPAGLDATGVSVRPGRSRASSPRCPRGVRSHADASRYVRKLSGGVPLCIRPDPTGSDTVGSLLRPRVKGCGATATNACCPPAADALDACNFDRRSRVAKGSGNLHSLERPAASRRASARHSAGAPCCSMRSTISEVITNLRELMTLLSLQVSDASRYGTIMMSVSINSSGESSPLFSRKSSGTIR